MLLITKQKLASERNVTENTWSLYVDGSCLGNQNVDAETPAAWAVVIVVGDNGLEEVLVNYMKNLQTMSLPMNCKTITSVLKSVQTILPNYQGSPLLCAGYSLKVVMSRQLFGLIHSTQAILHAVLEKPKRIGNLWLMFNLSGIR